MKIFMVFMEKKHFLFLFYCFHALISPSDVITDVVKQNRNIMTSTLSAYYKEREEQVFQQIKIILIPGPSCSKLTMSLTRYR